MNDNHDTSKTNLRGGRGRKAGPELTRAVHDVQASEERIKHDIARLSGDKERLTEQVKDLEARLKVAQEEGLLKSTVKRLEALLGEAHDKLNILNGVLPEQSISRDRALMEEVLEKWKGYERERASQARAESKINQTPDDQRAEGDFNRARTAAHAIKEEIHALIKQGELIVENDTANPVRDEWVSYTNEQAKVAAEAFTKKHPIHTVQSVPSVPLVPLIQDVPPVSEVPPTPTVLPVAIAQSVPPASEVAPVPLVLPDIHPLIQPTNEDDIDAHIAQEEKTAVEQLLPEVTEITMEEAPTAPQKFTSTDPQVLIYADQQVHKHINSLFGEKGVLGFHSIDGTNSPDWKDPSVGFENKTVAEITNISPEISHADKKKYIGTDNYIATNKMKEYLSLALDETGIPPLSEEKVGDYLRRASAITIAKFLSEKQ